MPAKCYFSASCVTVGIFRKSGAGWTDDGSVGTGMSARVRSVQAQGGGNGAPEGAPYRTRSELPLVRNWNVILPPLPFASVFTTASTSFMCWRRSGFFNTASLLLNQNLNFPGAFRRCLTINFTTDTSGLPE